MWRVEKFIGVLELTRSTEMKRAACRELIRPIDGSARSELLGVNEHDEQASELAKLHASLGVG